MAVHPPLPLPLPQSTHTNTNTQTQTHTQTHTHTHTHTHTDSHTLTHTHTHSDGIVVERGRHADLLSRRGAYYAMWQAQAAEEKAVKDADGEATAVERGDSL
jgi:hypothetical protein